MSERISSILIRKLGGWKLISIDQWLGMSAKKRDKLMTDGNVQFFDGDMPITSADAQVMLGLARPMITEEERYLAEQAIEDAQRYEPEVQEVPMLNTVNVMYNRYLRDGVRWIIDRHTSTSESQEFSLVRQRPAPEVYDLSNWHGATILSADLIADSLGIAEDGLSLINEHAVEHFRCRFVEPFLGTDSWEVSGLQIRESLGFNPYLKLTNGSW